MNLRFVTSCALTLTCSASVAVAEPLGRPGQVVLSGEHLLGGFAEDSKFEYTSTYSSGTYSYRATNKYSYSTTSLAFLGQGATPSDAGIVGPATLPRLAVDVFVTQGLSLGGSLLYWRRSGELESDETTTETVDGVSTTTSGSDSEDAPSTSVFQIAPRLGYAYALNDTWSIWPRAGVTHTRYSVESTDSETADDGTVTTTSKTESTLAFTNASLEFLFAASPIDNVAFLFGPYVDIPLTGSLESKTDGADNYAGNAPDVSYLSYGVTAGVGLVF